MPEKPGLWRKKKKCCDFCGQFSSLFKKKNYFDISFKDK